MSKPSLTPPQKRADHQSPAGPALSLPRRTDDNAMKFRPRGELFPHQLRYLQ
jgi:hypothetical protein